MPLNDNLPVGSIIIWAGDPNELPVNWKVCNGKDVLKSDCPELYAVLGTYWDNDKGAGADRFCLPDLRGVFLRGVNEDRNDGYRDVDVEKRVRLKKGASPLPNSPGSFQLDAVKKHNHDIEMQSWGGIYATPEAVSGNTAGSDGNIDSSQISDGYDRNSVPLVITDYGSSIETRPVNAYVYFIIKIKEGL